MEKRGVDDFSDGGCIGCAQRGTEDQIPFAFPAIRQYLIADMFDTIRAQLTTAGEKLAHLRRFL
jgi:hypothetical protein